MNPALIWTRFVNELTSAATSAAEAALGRPAPTLMPTPRDVIASEAGARLYRFVGPGPHRPGPPILLVPSMINRWYVLDLRPGASLVEALVGHGLDVFCLDWGTPEDEDRYLTWDDVLARLRRMVRRTLRAARADRLGVLGYCMGGTLTAIHAALEPASIAALATLAAPIDFREGGMLARMVDPRWFDADAIAAAGNVAPEQMQAGFVALRPTLDLAKWVSMPETVRDPASWTAFRALDVWASDNIPFPAAAYRTYIRELYQDNQLIEGRHRALGRAVDLGAITCPTLTIVADRDAICPPAAATRLLAKVGSADTTTLRVPGGHVGAVVGSRAARDLYPKVADWFATRLAGSTAVH